MWQDTTIDKVHACDVVQITTPLCSVMGAVYQVTERFNGETIEHIIELMITTDAIVAFRESEIKYIKKLENEEL